MRTTTTAADGTAQRQPFRPLLHAPEMSWHVAEDGRVSVFVRKGRKQDVYHVFPLETSFGGCAFRWHKLDGSGTVHDLTLNRVVAQYCGTVPRLACGASPHAA